MKTFNNNAIIYTIAVIPAKAGIHFDLVARARWIPAFAGMTAAVGMATKRTSRANPAEEPRT